MVVEVLSASTDYDHHVEKLALYARRDALRHYAVFEQQTLRAFLWPRTESGWPDAPTRIEGAQAVVALPSIGASLALSEIYR